LPEFAAWRYGGHYLARYRRELRLSLGSQLVMATAYGAKWIVGSALPMGVLAGIGVTTVAMQWSLTAAHAQRLWLPRRVLHTAAHGPRAVTHGDAKATRVCIDEQSGVNLVLASRPVVSAPPLLRRLGVQHLWTGGARTETRHSADESPRLLASILGASHVQAAFGRKQVDAAVNVMVEHVHRAPTEPGEAAVRLLTNPALGIGRPGDFPNGRPLDSMPWQVRLAAEMALHEDDERRALAGELGALYARWEAAERIARIADGELTRLVGAEPHEADE
jgi:hypothetical protein